MVRDLLSILISIVALESTFSTDGGVLDQFRKVLNLRTVEALIYTRDWLFGKKR